MKVFLQKDDHTLSSQSQCQRIDFLETLLSFPEEFVGDGGCVLRDLVRGLDVQSKPRVIKTKFKSLSQLL